MNQNNQRLEEVLKLAATEPAHRPEFFTLLMDASVWVPGESLDEAHRVSNPATVNLRHWKKEDGSRIIPFFTSASAMEQAVSDEQPFLVIPVRTLFAMTKGETLFLNPELPSGKEFTPAEIQHLLTDNGNALTQHRVLEGGTALLLSGVTEPPTQMLNSLIGLFTKYKQVRRAFIAHIKESSEEAPNLLIGIEADSDIATIIQAAGNVATDTLIGDDPVDLCQVSEGEAGISHFFTAHITPFYERKWGSFLREFKAGAQS
ncbi:enhanced serine sensitivity protein SseB [Erwinia tracheiphila]|uniref:Enhanced serine sensitivity protein SseB n=1 Tax=Erwinia tracheiphila TaxID=65700 RepID=A0A0M2K4C3_9GAMM|nr:enhanced serine sensitivity protein SseB [Erwinia tracheiphila]EOS94350.1 enhanced serine sensitivity protein SseB [Erwinia tracheiphila PSU-1]KKF34245.1 enhanced serine sensitivity protein SseB [Erwinia tracheiphila]UIA89274.1 enhanced serine sensitivity protein SseB [Erwinia tracheiphila]UIA97657.1 enhanced serine sensitivity protein SseB [Erwinia tracheiphila]